MVKIDVLYNAASIHFTSRVISGAYLFATYSYSFACERHQRDIDGLPVYKLASGVCTAV